MVKKGHQSDILEVCARGDSLSPTLFIIAMDVLHRLFQKAAADGVMRKMEPPEIKF